MEQLTVARKNGKWPCSSDKTRVRLGACSDILRLEPRRPPARCCRRQARSQDLCKGGQKLIDTRGVARILVRGGKTSHKISSKVARISVRSSDILEAKIYSTKTFKKF